MFEPFARHCEVSGARFVVVPAGFGLTPPQANAADGYFYSDDDDHDHDDDDDDDDDEDGDSEDDDITTDDEEAAGEDVVRDSGAWG